MEPVLLQQLAVEALMLLFLLSLPILAAALFSGVLSGLLATYTRLSDPAIGSVARAIAVVATLALIAPWLGVRVVSFAQTTWQLLSAVAQ